MILLDPADPGCEALADPGAVEARVRLRGERARRIERVVATGASRLRVGRLRGPRGHATIRDCAGDGVELEVTLDPEDLEEPPTTDLLLAMPRPKQLKRSLHHAVSLGVAQAHAKGAMREDEDGYSPSRLLGIVHMYVTALEVSPLGSMRSGIR